MIDFKTMVFSVKDKTWTILVFILLIIVLILQIRSPKKIDTSKIESIQKVIDSRLDSISKKEYKITVEKQDVSLLEKRIIDIQKDIKSINEKLKKDTAFINTYSDSSINEYFRARYHY